nr:HDIG domain-containing protein [Candidatus Njordarchaeum guaymaensis]
MLKGGIPSKRECLLLLRQLGVDEKVVKHSVAVSRTSLEIANRIRKNGVDVDTNLVEVAALLHDIGRSEVHGIEHGRVGGEILRKLGYHDSLARIAESHVLCGVLTEKSSYRSSIKNNDSSTMTIEEKIVCYADKITLENRKTTLKDRFDKWFRQYGRSSILTRAFHRSKEIEMELNLLVS